MVPTDGQFRVQMQMSKLEGQGPEAVEVERSDDELPPLPLPPPADDDVLDDGDVFELPPLPPPADDDDEGPMNGSCMPGPGRSRSPPRRAQQPLPLSVRDVLSSLAAGSDVLSSQTQLFPEPAASDPSASLHQWLRLQTHIFPAVKFASPAVKSGFIPKYAENAVSNLPCEISCRFPDDRDEEMEFDAKMRHCRQTILKIMLPNPQISKWYIGITASPDWRWGPLGHSLEYNCMVLLLVARTSADNHRLEEALIRAYAGWRGLQNIKPEAKGSKQGCPHFLYLCFGTGPLRRGGRN